MMNKLQHFSDNNNKHNNTPTTPKCFVSEE